MILHFPGAGANFRRRVRDPSLLRMPPIAGIPAVTTLFGGFPPARVRPGTREVSDPDRRLCHRIPVGVAALADETVIADLFPAIDAAIRPSHGTTEPSASWGPGT